MTKDEIIWNNVEMLLLKKGWSLSRFAKEAHTRPQALNSIKSGIRGIGPNLLKRFAAALGVEIEEMLKTEGYNSLCIVNCDLEMMNICKKIKTIRDSKTHWWDSLKQNIDSFKIGLDNDVEKGPSSDMPKKTGQAYRIKTVGRVIYVKFSCGN